MKFLSLYITFLSCLMTVFFPVFMAGMMRGSINTNHLDTALITAGVLVIFWPLLAATSFVSVRSCITFYGSAR